MRSLRGVLPSFVIVNWLVAGTVAGASSELQALRTAVGRRGTTFFLRIPTPVHYTPAWVGSRIFALDISDVSTSRSSESLPLQSPLVSAYRLLSYRGAGGTPHLRLEVSLKQEAKVEARQISGGLELRIQGASAQTSPSNLKIFPANSQALPAALPKGSVIREIQVAKQEGSSVLEVEIVGNGTFQYRTMRLSNPDRIVVDIPNVHNQIRQRELPVNASPLRAVRVGQLSGSPLVSRVVLDLDSKSPFRVRSQSDALVVTIGDSPTEDVGNEAAGKSTPPMESSPQERTKAEPTKAKPTETRSAANAAPLSTKRDDSKIRLSQLPAAKRPEAGKVEKENAASSLPSKSVPHEPPQPDLTASRQPAKAAGALPPKAAPERVAEPALPAILGSSAAVTPQKHASSPEAPAAAGLTPPAGKNEDTDLVPKKESLPAGPEPKTLLAQLTAAPAGSLSATPPAGPPSQRLTYTGEPISVNLKNVDLKDFFRLIHEISGLNIVLDPNVSSTVTVVIDGGWTAVFDKKTKRTYFLRQKDEINNGVVSRITADSVVFLESSAGLSSKTVSREVVKPLSAK